MCMQRALIRDRVALCVMSEKESKTRNGDQGGIIIQEYRDCGKTEEETTGEWLLLNQLVEGLPRWWKLSQPLSP